MVAGEQHRATRMRQFKDLMSGKGGTAEECERDSKGQGRLAPSEASVPSTATTHMTEERAWGAGRLPESFQTDHAHCQMNHYCLILEFCHVPAEGMLSCSGQEETTARLKDQVNPARALCGLHTAHWSAVPARWRYSRNHCTNSPRKKFIICGVWCGVGAIRRSSSPRGTVG